MKQYYRNKTGKSVKISLSDGPMKSSLYARHKKGDESVKKNPKKEFKSNSDYYITITELFSKLRKNPVNHNPKKPFIIDAEFVRIKAGKVPVAEEHEDVKVKYLACVVFSGLEFSKLDKREIMSEEFSDNRKVYYIPISIIRPLIPSRESHYADHISGRDILDLRMFQYTGPIETFQNETVFTLANEVYLVNKPDPDNCKIRVII